MRRRGGGSVRWRVEAVAGVEEAVVSKGRHGWGKWKKRTWRGGEEAGHGTRKKTVVK